MSVGVRAKVGRPSQRRADPASWNERIVSELTANELAGLRALDTPTVCNALEAEAARRLAEREAVLIEAAKQPGFGIDVLERIVRGGGDRH